MKLLVFITAFASPHTLPLVRELLSYYDRVVVLAMISLTKERRQMGYDWQGDNVESLHYIDDPVSAQNLVDEANDVIFAFSDFHLLENRLRDGKTCWIMHERIFKKGILKWMDPRTWKLLGFCRRVRKLPVYFLAIGEYAAKDFRKLGFCAEKIFRFGYFLDTDSALNLSSGTHSGVCHIFWVGRMIRWKKPLFVIRMMKKLPVDFTLEMAGDGVLLSKARRAAEKSGANVTLLGNIPNDTVREHMQTCDLFLSASGREEGWGVVINEAMASGCAVVCNAKMGCVGSLATEKNAILVNRATVRSFKEAILKAYRNRDILSENARNTVRDEFNAQIAAERFVALRDETVHPPFASGLCSRAFEK